MNSRNLKVIHGVKFVAVLYIEWTKIAPDDGIDIRRRPSHRAAVQIAREPDKSGSESWDGIVPSNC